jgi:hypothetical protein
MNHDVDRSFALGRDIFEVQVAGIAQGELG